MTESESERRPTCDEARLALWPQPGAGGDSPEAAAALAHYTECAPCRAFFTTQGRLASRLHRVARAQRAPRGLRDRVHASLGLSQADRFAGRRWRRRSFSALVGLAAAAVALLLLVGPPMGTTDRLAQPFVQEALRDAPDESTAGLDHAGMARWFAEQLGREIFVMEMPDAELMGGYVTRVGDVPSAVLRYRMHGVRLTYIVVPGERVMDRPVADGEVIALASRGLEVLIWGEPGAAHVVVAPMPREALIAIAEECRRQMRAAV